MIISIAASQVAVEQAVQQPRPAVDQHEQQQL
ncbi:hypothetical protein KCO_12902 [Pectobacterium brasiliense ICMP 19477]|nr:hypothetical protein KCO_12902 [Pectobacterium brasiliense ICMP 19477]